MEKLNDETKLAFDEMRRDLVRYILIGLLCTLIGLITPVITKSFVDGIIPLAARNQAVQICILVFVCNISAAIGSLSKYLAYLRMETRANTDLEAAFMKRLLHIQEETSVKSHVSKSSMVLLVQESQTRLNVMWMTNRK